MKNGNWEVYHRSDIYMATVTNDEGESWEREHEAFYVVAEDAKGNRYAHFHSWTTQEMSQSDAKWKAEEFANKVRKAQMKGAWAGPDMNNGLWRSIQPAYGSEAYTGEVAFEQDLMEARSHGEEADFLDSCRRNGRVY